MVELRHLGQIRMILVTGLIYFNLYQINERKRKIVNSEIRITKYEVQKLKFPFHLIFFFSFFSFSALNSFERQFDAIIAATTAEKFNGVLFPTEDILYVSAAPKRSVCIDEDCKNGILGLNQFQRQAVESSIDMIREAESSSASTHSCQTPKMLIIHGPPGTGKSSTIAALIKHLLLCTELTRGGPILVAAPSNQAVDALFMKIKEVSRFLSLKYI